MRERGENALMVIVMIIACLWPFLAVALSR
jgi:nitrate reductase NapE component